MRLLLLFLFLAYPILEISLMIKVGGAIGFWPMLGIIVVSALVGAAVIQRYGISILLRMTEEMAAGRTPIATIIDGALVCTAGLLLIGPGLITDALGLLLLVPPLRGLIGRQLARFVRPVGEDGFARAPSGEDGPERTAGRGGGQDEEDRVAGHFTRDDRFTRKRRPPRGPIVIDGEYERIDERIVETPPPGAPRHRPAND